MELERHGKEKHLLLWSVDQIQEVVDDNDGIEDDLQDCEWNIVVIGPFHKKGANANNHVQDDERYQHDLLLKE